MHWMWARHHHPNNDRWRKHLVFAAGSRGPLRADYSEAGTGTAAGAEKRRTSAAVEGDVER